MSGLQSDRVVNLVDLENRIWNVLVQTPHQNIMESSAKEVAAKQNLVTSIRVQVSVELNPFPYYVQTKFALIRCAVISLVFFTSTIHVNPLEPEGGQN